MNCMMLPIRVLALVVVATFPVMADEAFTLWEDGVEAFVEYPPLVAGESAVLIVHLTRLDGNQPVREGRLTLRLQSADGFGQSVVVDAPVRSGIYLPELTPERAGTYTLTLELDHPQYRHRVDAPGVQVHDSDHRHGHDHDHEDEGITFLKEAQWRMAFSGEAARREAIAMHVGLSAVVEAAPGRRVAVVAPVQGILRPAAGRPWPQPGQRVQPGEAIAELVPLAGLDDLARLESDLGQAESRLRLAQTELARVRGLVEDGVIAQRRLDEAQADEETARSAREAAASRMAGARDAPAAGNALALRTPLSGVIVTSPVAPGEVVEAGGMVAGILDARRVWVRVQVPAQDIPSLTDPQGLQVRRPGSRDWSPLAGATLVYRGNELEAGALPLVFEVDNDGDLLPGLPLIAGLAVDTPVDRITIPESALLDDDGVDVVIVQQGGESFERRPVRVGVRAVGRAAILDGLVEGERVIVEGAYAVLLAGRDPGSLDHGHAH